LIERSYIFRSNSFLVNLRKTFVYKR